MHITLDTHIDSTQVNSTSTYNTTQDVKYVCSDTCVYAHHACLRAVDFANFKFFNATHVEIIHLYTLSTLTSQKSLVSPTFTLLATNSSFLVLRSFAKPLHLLCKLFIYTMYLLPRQTGFYPKAVVNVLLTHSLTLVILLCLI